MMSPNELWANAKQAWPFAGGWKEPQLSILTWLKWNFIMKKKKKNEKKHFFLPLTAKWEQQQEADGLIDWAD